MNSLEILNIFKSDAFTKTVFTDVLPSDRLPGRIQTRPRGFIVNTDPADKPGTHWLVIFITTDGKGEFWDPFAQRPGFYSPNFTQFFEQTLQHIHVEQKSFASRIIRHLWTICSILCATSM